MTVWRHSALSQRATKPPSAAVRQRSIALMTFNCSRLIWPRLASRQAGPWSRKISATSRPERPIRAALGRLGALLLQFARLGTRTEMLERAVDRRDPAGGNTRIS